MAIAWRKEMAVDGGAIDDDHRTLIDIVNEFGATDFTVTGLELLHTILDELDEYTKIHFAREEQLQAAVLYPYRDAHHHEHQELIHRLASIRNMLGAASIGNSAARQVQVEMSALLHDWLVEHIIKSDLRMAPNAGAMANDASNLGPIRNCALKL